MDNCGGSVTPRILFSVFLFTGETELSQGQDVSTLTNGEQPPNSSPTSGLIEHLKKGVQRLNISITVDDPAADLKETKPVESSDGNSSIGMDTVQQGKEPQCDKTSNSEEILANIDTTQVRGINTESIDTRHVQNRKAASNVAVVNKFFKSAGDSTLPMKSFETDFTNIKNSNVASEKSMKDSNMSVKSIDKSTEKSPVTPEIIRKAAQKC